MRLRYGVVRARRVCTHVLLFPSLPFPSPSLLLSLISHYVGTLSTHTVLPLLPRTCSTSYLIHHHSDVCTSISWRRRCKLNYRMKAVYVAVPMPCHVGALNRGFRIREIVLTHAYLRSMTKLGYEPSSVFRRNGGYSSRQGDWHCFYVRVSV